MKRFLPTALGSVRFLFLILLPLAITMEQEHCTPEDRTNAAGIFFRLLYKDVCPLTKNILSETTYDFQIQCAMNCLENPFCAGYNFKSKQQQKTANCQLTHTLDHNFYECKLNDKGWIFYHPVSTRKVPCHKMKSCKNGGKTIIYLKDGPGSDPYRCECPKAYSGDLCQNAHFYSTILSGEQTDFLTRLVLWTRSSNNSWTLCWRATKHGWAASTFHGKCDHKKPTVTIIKVGNFIFGGYATESWHQECGSYYNCYKKAPGSFLFSLRNKENLAPFKAPLKDQNRVYAIYTGNTYGPTFGSHDIYISNKAASNTNSLTNFNDDYQAPSGVSDTNTILAGTYYFTPSEVEVFHIDKN